MQTKLTLLLGQSGTKKLLRQYHIRNLVKEAGGKWDSTEKVWSLPYRKAVEFGLEKRIV